MNIGNINRSILIYGLSKAYFVKNVPRSSIRKTIFRSARTLNSINRKQFLSLRPKGRNGLQDQSTNCLCNTGWSNGGYKYDSCSYSNENRILLTPVSMAYASFKSSHISDHMGSPPIVIMHGLMGSKSNWKSLAKVINQKTGRTVYTVDARNHGESPHTPEMNYLLLAEDLKSFLREHSISKACIVGHSMGGRAAMAFALTNSSLIEKLFVVDISPLNISENASMIPQFVEIMRNAALPSSVSLPEGRKHVDVLLKDVVEEAAIRLFLVSNLAKSGDEFYWKVNLDAIAEHFLPQLSEFSMENMGPSFDGYTHFLAGQLSKYIRPEDESTIRKIFPKASFSYVTDAGHWVHADKPKEFLDLIIPSIMS